MPKTQFVYTNSLKRGSHHPKLASGPVSAGLAVSSAQLSVALITSHDSSTLGKVRKAYPSIQWINSPIREKAFLTFLRVVLLLQCRLNRVTRKQKLGNFSQTANIALVLVKQSCLIVVHKDCRYMTRSAWETKLAITYKVMLSNITNLVLLKFFLIL